MSQTRRLRREAARQQAQLRLRRALAARREHQGNRPWWAFWSSPRRTIGVIVALILAFAIGFPVLAPPSTSTTAQPTPSSTPVPMPPLPPELQLPPEPPAMTLVPGATYTATISTTKGAIRVNLFAQESPVSVNNFVNLARQTFYRETPILLNTARARVFMGAKKEDGTGGPGYGIPPETSSTRPTIGSIIMVDQGDGTLGSQFIIALEDQQAIQGVHTVMGRVQDGLDVARRLRPGDQILNVGISETQPSGG